MADGFFSDIYVLVDHRKIDVVNEFLEYFVPDNQVLADEYEIPQYSYNPEIIFRKATELMHYCETNVEATHSIYWFNNQKKDPRNAMVFYTNDRKMILGLSILHESQEREWLTKLKQFSKSKHGCILYERPPPENSADFKELIQN
jgi:hypothetical protein